ncbi:MAG: hypothetical protein FJ271_33680 [Planctomycetes bacterium]|nr:hypothetical protein [Planctomycetota bacterium]
MPSKVTCPNCSGLGVVFILDVQSRKVQVACGHSVCLQSREDAIFSRLQACARMANLSPDGDDKGNG